MIFDTNVLIYLSKDVLNPNKLLKGRISISVITKIKLPDAIIYATALVLDEPLVTNNIADFKSLGNKVELIDPFAL